MIYLSPKSDVAFKKLFGNIAHKNILISFLNSVLQRPEHLKIVDVVINDPANTPDRVDGKSSIVDIRCTDHSKNQYIVEMQVVSQKDYAARAQYYSSIALARQLNSAQKYDLLVPVIFVGVLNFDLFKAKNFLSHHLILDSQTQDHELKHLEFHFIELTKFNKSEAQLDSILDKWVYFLKNAEELQQVPVSFKETELTDAFKVLSQSNWSNQELLEYDRFLDDWRSRAGNFEAGEQSGIEKGRLEANLGTAANLLKVGLDIATIAKTTGLSIEQVEKLKKQN